MNVCNFICNNPKLKSTQISFQNINLTNYDTLTTNKMEQTTDTCNNLDKFLENYAESKSVLKCYTLYDRPIRMYVTFLKWEVYVARRGGHKGFLWQ